MKTSKFIKYFPGDPEGYGLTLRDECHEKLGKLLIIIGMLLIHVQLARQTPQPPPKTISRVGETTYESLLILRKQQTDSDSYGKSSCKCCIS